jgi:hypothetical protein
VSRVIDVFVRLKTWRSVCYFNSAERSQLVNHNRLLSLISSLERILHDIVHILDKSPIAYYGLKTLIDRIFQYDCANSPGFFATNSSQVRASALQGLWSQTLPAQPPQNVVWTTCVPVRIATTGCGVVSIRSRTYNVHVAEVVVKITPVPVRNGRAPSRRIRIRAQRVCGHSPPRPVPHLDAVGGPEQRVHAAARCVEHTPVSALDVVEDSTADVAVPSTAVRLPRSLPLFAGGTDGGDAPGLGVDCDLVVHHDVHAFDDVDLAVCGPFRADEEEGGPEAADLRRHVFDVGDEETAVKRTFAAETDGVAPFAKRVENGGAVGF